MKKQVRRNNVKIKEPLGKRAKKFFLRLFKIIIYVSAPAALVIGVWYGYKEFTTSRYLALKKINVIGARTISTDEIIGLSGLEEGRNLFSFKVGAVENAIRKNPWVESVTVKRDLPDVVNINIREREPVALVKLGDIYVMDVSGVIFKKASVDDELDLPIVTGFTIDDVKRESAGVEGGLLELIRALRVRNGFNYASISEIHADEAFGFTLYTLDEGVRVEIGKGGYEKKLASFDRIVRMRGGSLDGIEAMNLMNDREVMVRYTANVVREGGEKNGKKG